VICRRVLQLGGIGLALGVAPVYADRSLLLSSKHLVAESSTVMVTHDHDVKQIKTPAALGEGKIVLDLNSTLRIVRKRDNVEIFKQAVMPLTALTSVDEGRYFAGLSSLQAISSQYNFLLISASGQIVTTALITANSGNCGSVRSTTTNFIGWFDEAAPDVRLSFAGDRVDSVTVLNPYDRAADGSAGRCVIPVAPAASDRL
jgi:hypothetical protein